MSNEKKSPVHSGVQTLRLVLLIAAVVVMMSGCGMGLYWVGSHDPVTPKVWILAVGCLVAGLVTAVLMTVASAVVGMLYEIAARHNAPPADDVRPALERLEQSLQVLNTRQMRTAAAVGEATGLAGSREPLLEQIRDLTLMDAAQRARFAALHWARRKAIHLEGIEREVLIGDWESAFARLEELEVVMPGDPQMAELRERVESEQTARLEEEVRVARGRMRQMMNATLWQQAEELIAALQEKYPGKAEPVRLGEELRREREAFERESMERLFHDISAASERRQWRQAMLAIEEFTRRYPLDPRAEALRLDLPTLQENAAAQERKEQEENFKDLLKRQRYDEAILTARAVVAKYPQSATATELNRLLPKVEELARQELAKAAGAALVGVPGAGAAVPAGAGA